MSASFGTVVAVSALPGATAVIGATLAAWRQTSPSLRGQIQHLAAGVVLAAAAGELLPVALAHRRVVPMVVGLVLGSGLMLGIGFLTRRQEQAAAIRRLPLGLLTAVAVDVFVDGAPLGLGFAASIKAGLLLGVAFALETLSVGLSLATTLRSYGFGALHTIAASVAAAVLFSGGAVLAAAVAAVLAGSVTTAVIAVGVAGLVYLAVEGLLGEAHERADTQWTAVAFFSGFVSLLVLDSVS